MHCVGSSALYDPPGGKGFWARRSDLNSGDSSFYRVTSMFSAASKNAEIYTEAKKDVPKSAIDGLLSAFENNVVPVEHLWYTTPTDVDGSGKVILLLLDIQDGYQAGGGYIAGYFDPINHYSEAAVNATNSKYHSNHAEMLYLDTYPGLDDALRKNNLTQFYATLAHEYQHLLQFGKYYRGEQSDVEPAWVDEGLAEVSSDLTGFGPQTGRANNFRTALLKNTSLVYQGSSFGLDNYATSYIYFRYIADVYGLGGIASIFNNNAVGLDGVNSALSALDTSLLTNCGSTGALSYPHFACSYRFMWGSMANNVIGDSPDGVRVIYNGSASAPLSIAGNYNYKSTPATQAYKQELADSLAAGGPYTAAGSPSTGALQSYGVKLYKNNNTGADPGFSLCTSCGLTMVSGSKYFAVFNHDVSTTTTHGGTVSDNFVSASLQEDTSVALAEAAQQLQSAPLETRKLHWHFGLQPELREFLTP